MYSLAVLSVDDDRNFVGEMLWDSTRVFGAKRHTIHNSQKVF